MECSKDFLEYSKSNQAVYEVSFKRFQVSGL